MGFLDSVVGGATQFLGGLVGVNTQDMPNLAQAKLDPDTKAILDQRIAESNAPAAQTEQNIVNEQNRGVAGAGAFLSGGAGAGVNNPMQSALQARQNRQFGSTTNRMKRSDILQAPAERFSRIASTIGTVRNDAANAMEFARNQKLAQQNQEFAENRALANILGSAGSAFGGAIGGSAGSNLGGSAGRTVASAKGTYGDQSYLSGGTPGGNGT